MATALLYGKQIPSGMTKRKAKTDKKGQKQIFRPSETVPVQRPT
jgi:hypothetical protein